MSKKFGKFLLFSAMAGAAAYGVYSYMQKKEQETSFAGVDDTDDDFDDFSEDLDEEPVPTKVRSYVSLNLDKAEAIATEAFHKAKEVITDSVNQVRETVKSVTESQSASETNFTDLTALQKETAKESADTETVASENPAETAAPAKEASDETAPETSSQQPTEDTVEAANTPKEKAAPSGQVEEFFDDTP